MSSPGAIDTFRLSAQRHGWRASRRRCVWGQARARVRARGTRRGEGRKPTALGLCCAFRGADGLIMGHPMVGGACMCLKWRRWRRLGEFVAMAVLPAFSARRAAQTATSEGTSSLSGCSRAQRTPIQYAMYAPRRSWVRGSHGRPTSHVSAPRPATCTNGGTRVKRTNCRMEGWLWRGQCPLDHHEDIETRCGVRSVCGIGRSEEDAQHQIVMNKLVCYAETLICK